MGPLRLYFAVEVWHADRLRRVGRVETCGIDGSRLDPMTRPTWREPPVCLCRLAIKPRQDKSLEVWSFPRTGFGEGALFEPYRFTESHYKQNKMSIWIAHT